MKKIIAIILTLAMIAAFCACGKEKEEAGIDVYVSIAAKGEVKLAAEKIRVKDANNDGKYDLDEVLLAAHTAKAPNKADSYASEEGAYGLAIAKLWDDANGMSGYGYYINNVSAMSLGDEVKEGDYVYAYSYADLTYWSDTFTWFDKFAVDADGKEITLHLYKGGFDENWAPVTEDYANATILLNGMPFGTTDENGEIGLNITGTKGVSTVISVADPELVIVPAVCVATSK